MICYCSINHTMIDILGYHQGMPLDSACAEASRILSHIQTCQLCQQNNNSQWLPLITLAIANKKRNYQIRDLKIDRALRRVAKNNWFSPKDACTILLALDVLNITHNPQFFTVKLSSKDNKEELEQMLTRSLEMGYLWKALSTKQRDRVRRMGFTGNR